MAITKAIQDKFIEDFIDVAIAAGEMFGINPLIILAQAAIESAWGTSKNAREGKNFFGLVGYGSINKFWKGLTRIAGTGIKFRVYDYSYNSFYDYARLISTKYKNAAAQSYDVRNYAKAIAYSPYIDEKNGDNRPVYAAAIISSAAIIEKYLKENNLLKSWRRSDAMAGVATAFFVTAALYALLAKKKTA